MMRALSMLIKPASGSCNMRCRYCFYADITDNREVKSHGVMRLDTLEAVVRRALSEAAEFCAFGFQGGEPTLAGLGFFKTFIELEKKHNANRARVSHTLQTNGLLLDEAWCEFLRENKFLVGLSIDAGKQIHDSLRPDSAGKGTHNRAMAAARLLTKHNVDFNILSVVTRQLAAHPDKAYQFYKQNGFRYIQFVPCLDGLGEAHGSNAFSLDAKTYGGFLCRVFDLWYADFAKDDYVSIRIFDNYVSLLAGQPPENCAMNGVCTAYALVEADGGVYPCDFYALDDYLLGNAATHSFGEMLSGEKAEAFITPSRHVDAACKACEYFPLCRGGCRRDREPFAGGLPILNVYCEAYKRFFAHALPRMREIAKQLREAKAVRRRTASR